MKFLKQLSGEFLSLLFNLYNNKGKLFGTLLIIIFILSFIYIQNFPSFLLGILAYLCITFILLVITLFIPLIIGLVGMFIMTKKSYYYCYFVRILINFKYTKYPILNSIFYYGSIIGTYCYSLYMIFIIQCKQGYIEISNTLIMPVLDNFYILEELCGIF